MDDESSWRYARSVVRFYGVAIADVALGAWLVYRSVCSGQSGSDLSGVAFGLLAAIAIGHALRVGIWARRRHRDQRQVAERPAGDRGPGSSS